MKFDYTDKYKKKDADIAHLWQPDNEEWLERRKKVALGLVNMMNQQDREFKAVLRDYYFLGKQSEYIPANNKFMMTPIDSPEQALEVFNSEGWDNQGKKDIYTLFIFAKHHNSGGIPRQIYYFVKGVLENKDLDLSFLDKDYAKHMLGSYIRESVRLLSRQVVYTCNVVAFEHFMSLIKQDQDDIAKHASDLRKMLDLTEEVYHDEYAESYDLAYIHAQQIMEHKEFLQSKL